MSKFKRTKTSPNFLEDVEKAVKHQGFTKMFTRRRKPKSTNLTHYLDIWRKSKHQVTIDKDSNVNSKGNVLNEKWIVKVDKNN